MKIDRSAGNWKVDSCYLHIEINFQELKKNLKIYLSSPTFPFLQSHIKKCTAEDKAIPKIQENSFFRIGLFLFINSISKVT